MLPKVVLAVNAPAIVIILRLLGTQGDISMAKLSKQLVKWYKEIII